MAIDDATGQASVHRLRLVKDALRAAGCGQVIFIADARLRHRFEEQNLELFRQMIKSRDLYQAPAGTSADQFVIDLAKRKDGFVVSNDLFRDHSHRWDQLRSRLIKFLIIEDHVLLSGSGADLKPAAPKTNQEADDSVTAVLHGKTSSWFDVFVTVPSVSVFGGFLTAAVWMLALGGIFAPLYGLGASPAGLTLFAIAAAMVVPVAALITLGIGRWFLQEESPSLPLNEVHVRAYAAIALLLWLSGLLVLLLYLTLTSAESPAWPLVVGLALGIGPAFPLIGFIRSTEKFRDFTNRLDVALVVAVRFAAIAWLVAESAFLFFVARSEGNGIDRALIATVLALLAFQALVVLGRWVLPVGPLGADRDD